jgi:hypothetical protein
MEDRNDKQIKLVEMRHHWFKTDDEQTVNLEECSHALFDAFIVKYLEIEKVDRTAWDLMTRWRAVNFAVKNGQFLAFCEAPEILSKGSKP